MLFHNVIYKMDGRMDGGMIGWMDGLVEGWMDVWIKNIWWIYQLVDG